MAKKMASQGNVNKNRGVASGMKAERMGHSSPVYSINTNSEAYDMGRVKPYKQGSRGYPAQAWEYQY